LERDGAWTTPYQRFDLLAGWQRHVGARKGIVPYIVVAFDTAGKPLFLWPFGRKATGPVTVARFLGGKHASFNLGVWRRALVPAIAKGDLGGILARLAARPDAIDLFALANQPLEWAGVANPLALLQHQWSAEAGARLSFRGPLEPGGEGLSAATRSRLRTKERKLKRLSGYRYLQAASDTDIDRMLDAFFALKAPHMAAQGLPNVFAEPGVAEFLRLASHVPLPDGRRLIEIHALEGGGEVLAICGAIADDHRLSAMFNTYTLSDNSRHSPGLVLLQHMVAACPARGLRAFDLGVGGARYKSLFCKEPEPLFDSFLALTPRGRLMAPVLRAALAAKGAIKTTPTLWAVVKFLRGRRASPLAPGQT
jgi:CelD/BcsL family acetyltransferase involved in cellulose biosynthesis